MGELPTKSARGRESIAKVWRLPVFCEAKHERSSRGRLGQTADRVRSIVMLSAFAVVGVPRSERASFGGSRGRGSPK